VVLVLEPDSLPNMITNMKNERPDNFRGCNDETQTSYMDGITYAVNTFAETDAQMYLDAGHGGWLGWANPDEDKALMFAGLIAKMGVHTKMRGFATNVANYQAVGEVLCAEQGICRDGNKCQNGNCRPGEECCKYDPCDLTKSWNWGHTELNYVDVLADRAMKAMPGWDVKFIVDTGRNGKPAGRTFCGNWCNPRNMGIGHVPTTNTPHPRIDALYWLKTPGESDGCTEETPDGKKCPRFDEMCASEDSLGSNSGEPRAPEAGLWYDYQIKQLAENAELGDEWWVNLYDKHYEGKCRAKNGGCADPMPTMAPTPPPTLPPGKCVGQHNDCNGKSSRAACYSAADTCKWTGCCGGSACKSKPGRYKTWICKQKTDKSSCLAVGGDCDWEEPPSFFGMNSSYTGW
jgi:cellulase/cellobiase CelA1